MWLHRRSEEPAVTSIKSYWKKSKLSCIGTTVKFIKAKDLAATKCQPITSPDGSFLAKVVEKSRLFGRDDTVLTKYYSDEYKYSTLSVYHLSLKFFQSKLGNTAEEFLNYCSSSITDSLCCEAQNETLAQSESNLWHQLRFGRVTASKAHEASRCNTLDGSLVETILGANKLKDTAAIERGRKLEKYVRAEIEKKKNLKIKLCGFTTSAENPIMGASPDGITEEHVIEIKCPSSEKATKNYMKDGKLSEKCNAQMQMQMYFLKKKKGLFCVASHDFEQTKNISISETHFDLNMCKELIQKCNSFWTNAIFPIFKNNNS